MPPITASPQATDVSLGKSHRDQSFVYFNSMKRCSKPYRFPCSRKRNIVPSVNGLARASEGALKTNSLGHQHEKISSGRRVFGRRSFVQRWFVQRRLCGGCGDADESACVQGRGRSLQELRLSRYLSRHDVLGALLQLLPARMGARCGARRSQGAAIAARGLAGDASINSALSLHRMALWRHNQPWRDAAEFGRQSLDDGDQQHHASEAG